jgi:hypothetical protein
MHTKLESENMKKLDILGNIGADGRALSMGTLKVLTAFIWLWIEPSYGLFDLSKKRGIS